MAEEEAPEIVDTEVPTGSFNVNIDALKIVSDSDETRSIEGSCWAQVQLVNASGIEASTYWWSTTASGDTEEDLMEVEKSHSTLFDVPNTLEEPEQLVEYNQQSKSIPLTESALSDLSACSLSITLYNGTTKEPSTDKNIGFQSIALSDVLLNLNVSKTLAIKDSNEEEKSLFELSIRVGCDNDLAEFALGGRVLSVSDFSMQSLPTEWKLQLEEGEDPESVLLDKARNVATYSLSFTFPSSENEACFTNGILAFVKEEESTGDWVVSWKDSKSACYLTKESISVLQKPEFESAIPCSISRSGPALEDEWNIKCVASFSDLFNPGVVEMINSTTSATELGSVTSRAELEAKLEGATAKDEKQRISSQLETYDEFLTKVAGRAAVLSSSSLVLQYTVRINKEIVSALAKTPPPPLKSITELIPPRDPLPPYPTRDACKELQHEVKNIVVVILQEYEALFNASEDVVLSREEQKKKLIYQLNTEGVYHDFKELIKRKIVAVVNEKFPQAPSGGQVSRNDCDFYTKLYTFLMEQVNCALNSIFHQPNQVAEIMLPTEVSSTDDGNKNTDRAVLLHKAREAESRGDFGRASEYHLERISATEVDELNASVWYEYALFCFRRQDLDRAAECLTQCLAIEPCHLPALQAFGALSIATSDMEKAEILLKNAVKDEVEGDSNTRDFVSELSHGLLAMFFHLSGKDLTGNLTSFELMVAKNRSTDSATRTTSCIHVAQFFIDLKLDVLAESALTLAAAQSSSSPPDSLQNPERVSVKLIKSKIHALRQELDAAAKLVREALEIDNTSADSWFHLGQIQHAASNDTDEVTESLGHALEFVQSLDRALVLTLYLQLGELYLQSSRLQDAKCVYVAACDTSPVASTWLGVGITCIREEDWAGAEEALAEANILDNTNAEVWGYLALLCLNVSPARIKEAKLSIEQALLHGLGNPTLLRELGNGLMSVDQLETAEAMLRRSLGAQDSSITRRRLADVLSARNCAEEALIEYQRYLEADKNVDGRVDLLNKCAKLLLTLGRNEEASEYLRMSGQQKEQQLSRPNSAASSGKLDTLQEPALVVP